MNRRPRILVPLLLLAGLATGLLAVPARARAAELTLGLIFPSEGETLYAGPTSMLYTLPVRGWAHSAGYPDEQITVAVRFLQDGAVRASASVRPDATGYWELPVTINPGADIENFPLEHRTCAPQCHYLSDTLLPAGRMVLEVTAADPSGATAVLQRALAVDRSAYARIPVQVALEGGDFPLEGIPVTGAARLYLWRTRYFVRSTEPGGAVQMRLESLSLAPTRYVLRVEPTIVNGVLYESVEPVEIALPAGATEAPPVTLRVRARAGRVTGALTGTAGMPGEPGRVYAVRSDGRTYSAPVDSQGAFSFEDIPLGPYAFTLDADALADQGYLVIPARIDLAAGVEQPLRIGLALASGAALRGRVTDAEGRELPFAWISAEGRTARTDPFGAFALYDLPSGAAVLEGSAPGYYARTLRVAPDGEAVIALTRRPDTRSLAWGDGEVVVPPESLVRIDAEGVWLERGWVWGTSTGGGQAMVRVGESMILMESGSFAVEQDPPSGRSWLYIIQGNAAVHGPAGGGVQTVTAGQMLSLGGGMPVSLDRLAFVALAPSGPAPFAAVQEPGLQARIRNRVNSLGIGAAQLVTSVTYGLILMMVVLLPFGALYSWARRRPRRK